MTAANWAPIDSAMRQQAQDVIDYWFVTVGKERWFAKDAALDREIAEKWGALHDEVLAANGEGWRDGPRRLLAAIILLDQFSRNIHRGKAEAFAGDALARRLTRRAIDKGWDQHMSRDYRHFLYMPLMHSEEMDDQEQCVALYEELGDPVVTRFAYLHRQQIANFGRFPGRNEALGRETTPEERIALEGGAAF